MIDDVQSTDEQLSSEDKKLLKGLIGTYDNPEETFEFLRLYRKASAYIRDLLNHYGAELVANDGNE